MTSANSALYPKKRVARHTYEFLVLAAKRPFRWPPVDFSAVVIPYRPRERAMLPGVRS